jgi:hypothetical protein
MMDLPPNIDYITQADSAYCIVSASHRFSLPPEALLSLAMVEGGRRGTSSINTNGSKDLGLMQVNTLWLKGASPLSAYVNFTSLVNDVCTNVHAAAWILATEVKKSGGDVWRAIGKYHHPSNNQLAQNYIVKVNGKLPLARKILTSVPEYQNVLGTFYGADAKPPIQR